MQQQRGRRSQRRRLQPASSSSSCKGGSGCHTTGRLLWQRLEEQLQPLDCVAAMAAYVWVAARAAATRQGQVQWLQLAASTDRCSGWRWQLAKTGAVAQELAASTRRCSGYSRQPSTGSCMRQGSRAWQQIHDLLQDRKVVRLWGGRPQSCCGRYRLTSI